MNEKRDAGASGWVDPDDAPELTDEFFDQAEIRDGDAVVRRGRGRPKRAETREQIALRVEQALLERYRNTGPGWQTRMHAALTLAGQNLQAVAELEKMIGFMETGDMVCRSGPDHQNETEKQIMKVREWIDQYRQANEALFGLLAENA